MIEETVEVRAICLTRNGNDIVVNAWMPDGSYREIIRENAERLVTHYAHASSIANAHGVMKELSR